MIALFAALIGPLFINWNDYKATFQTEAEKILGRPVEVRGSASATLLPAPSLTFEDVEVGEADGQPMMTVDRFEVTIDLMPLLQGEFRVVSMRLERPHVRVAVGPDGRLDWQHRNEASKALDPDRIVLQNVAIVDGQVDYVDEQAGTKRSLAGLNATIEAESLYGPWRIDGSYLQEGAPVPFRIATGRRLDDGTIRVRSDVSPAGWAASIAADGILGSDKSGFYYDGKYNVAEVVPASGTEAPKPPDEAAGWRSEGTFRLTSNRLVIAQGVVSEGPPDRPYSVAGSLTVDFGKEPKFEAHLTARQIDLDRSLGEGPNKPVDVASAARSLVGWLKNSYIPPIPGNLFFSVPGIVVGGAVIQDVNFEARPALGGWRITNFDATLPGAASLQLRGLVATNFEVDFRGDVTLAVGQPATLATWWRGQSQGGSARLLEPFEVSGRAEIAARNFLLDNIEARIGDSELHGRIAWSNELGRKPQRMIETDIEADRVDFTQLRALGELVVGEDFAHSGAIADAYAVKLGAKTLSFDEVTVDDVAIDASFAGDAVTVNEFGIGNLGGASLNVTQGRIEGLTTQPRGRLDAQLDADTLDGVISLAERLFPDHPLTKRLAAAGGSLSPAFLTASIEAPPAEGSSDFRVTLGGNLAATTLSAIFDLSGNPAEWQQGKASADIVVSSTNAREFARQAGIETLAAGSAGGQARLELKAEGVPSTGLDLKIAGDLAGLGVRSAGKLVLAPDAPPAFSGTVAAAADDLRPVVRMLDVDLPGAGAPLPIRFDGKLETADKRATLELKNSSIGERIVSGRASLAPDVAGGWQIGGDLHVDAADLDWLASLGLGTGLVTPGVGLWSKAPFDEPHLAGIAGSVKVAVDRLTLASGRPATGARMSLDFGPQRMGIKLDGAQFESGTLAGALAIHNVDGNANVTGRFDLKNAALDSLVWRRSERAVATGSLDLSAEFEGAGRSPASLISSLTGGGTIAIRKGEARYVNPRAAEQIVRAADLGQEFSEAELVQAFTRQIDGGSIPFDHAEGAFAIAAGVARAKSLIIDSDAAKATGSVAIDLAGLTIDSDWTLAFPPIDDRVQRQAPQVGIVFRGPLADPSRSFDVLQFGSYLNIRQEERLLEMLNEAEADRMERDRLNRERRKLREDADRRARDEAARIAAEIARLRGVALDGTQAAMVQAGSGAVSTEEARVIAVAQQWRGVALAGTKAAVSETGRVALAREAARVLAADEAFRAAALTATKSAAPEGASAALTLEFDRLSAEAAKRRAAVVGFGKHAAAAASGEAASREVARVAADIARRRVAALDLSRVAALAAGSEAAEGEIARLNAERAERRDAALTRFGEAALVAASDVANDESTRVAAEVAAKRGRAIAALSAGDGARVAAESEAARAAVEARQRAERTMRVMQAAARIASDDAVAIELDRLATIAEAQRRLGLTRVAASASADTAAVIENDRLDALAKKHRARVIALTRDAASTGANVAATAERDRLTVVAKTHRDAALGLTREAASASADTAVAVETDRLDALAKKHRSQAIALARDAASTGADAAVAAERDRLAAVAQERLVSVLSFVRGAVSGAAASSVEAESKRIAAEAERAQFAVKRHAVQDGARNAAAQAVNLAVEASKPAIAPRTEAPWFTFPAE